MPAAGGGPRLLCAACARSWRSKPLPNAAEKLVTVIASTCAEVCSIYLRRAGKILELSHRGPAPRRRPQEQAEGGRGPVGLISETASVTCRPPPIRISPTAGNRRRPVQVSWASHRAGGQVFACSRCRTSERIYPEEEVEGVATSPLVLAEVWRRAASSTSRNWTTGTAHRPAAQFVATACRRRGGGALRAARPRVKVERMIAEIREGTENGRRGIGSCANPGRDAGLQRTGPDRRGREVIEAYRLFCYDQGCPAHCATRCAPA